MTNIEPLQFQVNPLHSSILDPSNIPSPLPSVSFPLVEPSLTPTIETSICSKVLSLKHPILDKKQKLNISFEASQHLTDCDEHSSKHTKVDAIEENKQYSCMVSSTASKLKPLEVLATKPCCQEIEILLVPTLETSKCSNAQSLEHPLASTKHESNKLQGKAYSSEHYNKWNKADNLEKKQLHTLKHLNSVSLSISKVKSQKTQVIKLSKQSTISSPKHLVVEPPNFSQLQPLLRLPEVEISLIPTVGTTKCPKNSATQHPKSKDEKNTVKLLEASKGVSFSSKHFNEYTKANDEVLKHLHPIQQASNLLSKNTEAQPLNIAVQESINLPIEKSSKHLLTELSNTPKLQTSKSLSIDEPHFLEMKASNFQAVNTLPSSMPDPHLEAINHLYCCLINLNEIKEKLPGCYPDTSVMISKIRKHIFSHFQNTQKIRNWKILNELVKQVNHVLAIIFEHNKTFKLQKPQNVLTFESENILMPLLPVNSLLKESEYLTEFPTQFPVVNKLKQIPLPTESQQIIRHNDNFNQHNIVVLDQHSKVNTLEKQEPRCQYLLQSSDLVSTKVPEVDVPLLNQELVSFVQPEITNCSLVKEQKLTDVISSVFVPEIETLYNKDSETNSYSAEQLPHLAVVETKDKQNPLLPPMQCVARQNGSLNVSKNVENKLSEIPQQHCSISPKIPVHFKPVELLEKDMVVPPLLVAESSSIQTPLITLNTPEDNSFNPSIVKLPECTAIHQLPSKVPTNTPVIDIQRHHQGMEHLTQSEKQPKHFIIEPNKILKSTLSQHFQKKKSSFAIKPSKLSAVQKLQYSTNKKRQKRKPYFVTSKQRHITCRNVSSKQNSKVDVLEQDLQQYQQLQPLTMTPPILTEAEQLQTVTEISLNHQAVESLQQSEIFKLSSNAKPFKSKSSNHSEDETLLVPAKEKQNISTEYSSQLPIFKKKRKLKLPPTASKRQNVSLDQNSKIRVQEQNLQQHQILHTQTIDPLKLPEVEQLQSVVEKPLLNLQTVESLEQSESPKLKQVKLLDLSPSSNEFNHSNNITSPLTAMQLSELLNIQKLKLSKIKKKLEKLKQEPFLTAPKRHITRQNIKLNQDSNTRVLELDFQQHCQLKPPIMISPKLPVVEQQQTVKKKLLNSETTKSLQQSSSTPSNAKPSIFLKSLNQSKDNTLFLPTIEKQNISAVNTSQLLVIKKKRELPDTVSKRITRQNVNSNKNSKINVLEQNLQSGSLQHQTMKSSKSPVKKQLQSIVTEKPLIPKVLKTVEKPKSVTLLNMEPSINLASLMSLNGKIDENSYLPPVEKKKNPVVYSSQFPIIKKKQKLKPHLVAALKRITRRNASAVANSKVKALEKDLQQYYQLQSPSIALPILPKMKQLLTVTKKSLKIQATKSLQQSKFLNEKSLKSKSPNHSEDEKSLISATKKQNISASYPPQFSIMKKQRKLKQPPTSPKRTTRRIISSDQNNLEHSIIVSPMSKVVKQPHILQKKSMDHYTIKTLDQSNSPKSLFEDISNNSIPLSKSSVFPSRQLPVEKKPHFVNTQLHMTRITLRCNEFAVFENMEQSLIKQQKLQQEYPQYFYTSGPNFHKEIIRFTEWLHLKLIPIPITRLERTKIPCKNIKNNRIDGIIAQKLKKKTHQTRDYLSNKHTETHMTGIRKHTNVCKLKTLDNIISASASKISTCSSKVCTNNFTTTFSNTKTTFAHHCCITTKVVNKLVNVPFKFPRKNKGCRNLSLNCPYC